jgi:hypothetical protein
MKKMTIGRILCYTAFVGLALCLNQRVSAQDDHWNGTPGNNLWNNPANWSEGIVPPNDATAVPPYPCGNTNGPGGIAAYFAGNVWLDPANGDMVITVPAGDIEAPGVPQCGEENYNTIYGPEFGMTLNVYGSLSWDWTMAPYAPNPSARSHINMYNGSSMSTTGASINLGSGWWGISEGCYVTMNMYGNSQFSALGGAGIWWGGHLNVYDTASLLLNGYVNMFGEPYGGGPNINPCLSQSDGTRSLVIGGGTVTLPEGTMTGGGNSGSVASWVTRGILRPYGKGYETNDLIISDNNTNTIVTVVPLGGSLVRVYFQPVLKASVPLGTFQQLVLVGDYPAVTGVYLSSSEPGLDPASFPAPVYTSSNPNVISVDANGVATAVAPGSATVSAKVGLLTSVNTVTITVTDTICMAHRYSFTGSSGTNVADSVTGNPSYAATLVGGAVLGGGQVTLDGSTGYVALPAGILSGQDEVTIETWVSFGSPINTWAALYAFGYADTTGDVNNNLGGDYIALQPHTGTVTTQQTFGQGLPGFDGELDAVSGSTLDGMTNAHVVAVYHPYAGYEAFYVNGVLVATQSMFNNMSDPVAFAGPTYNSGSILAYTLGPQAVFDGATVPDPNNYIGKDDYAGDATLNGSIAEFRIYCSPLSAAQIYADYLLGPTAVIGPCTSVTLTVTKVGSNVVISWPTCSAHVTLVSSTSVSGPYTPVTNGTLTIVGANYVETVPITGSNQFFGLQ